MSRRLERSTANMTGGPGSLHKSHLKSPGHTTQTSHQKSSGATVQARLRSFLSRLFPGFHLRVEFGTIQKDRPGTCPTCGGPVFPERETK